MNDIQPNHYHDEKGDVKQSALTGDPVKDIEIVLKEISVFFDYGDALIFADDDINENLNLNTLCN